MKVKELVHLSSCIQLFHFSQIDNHPAEPREQCCASVCESCTPQFLFDFHLHCVCLCVCMNIKSLPFDKIRCAAVQPVARMTQTKRLLTDKRGPDIQVSFFRLPSSSPCSLICFLLPPPLLYFLLSLPPCCHLAAAW